MVISAKTGEPLRGARVTLQPNGRGMWREDRRQTTTDLEGRFFLTEVAAGEYMLLAEKTGYETRRGTRIGQIKLAQKQSKTKVVIPLRPAAVISGRVLDSFGEPLARADVGAFRRNFQPGSEEWRMVQGTTTDDLGEYRLYGLGMGKYIVGVAPQQEPSQDGAFILEQLPSFYPGVATPEESTPLKVTWGTEMEAIDFKLTAAPATVVSGILADGDTGEPLEGYMLLAAPNGARLGAFSTTKEGRFVMYGLPQADLAISGVSRKDRRMLTAHGDMHPSESRIEELELLVRSGASVAGKAMLEDPPEDPPDAEAGGSEGESGGSLAIQLNLQAPSARAMRRPLRAPMPAQGGPFEIRDVQSADYLVEADAPEGAYLRALARSGKTLDGFVLTVPPNSEITDLELRFAFDGGTITGTVDGDSLLSGDLGPDARIVIIPDGSEHTTAPTSAEVGEDGSFEITGVPPGGYTVFAVERRSVLDLWDPDVQQVFRVSGEHVSLDKKGSATVELTVIKEPDEPL